MSDDKNGFWDTEEELKTPDSSTGPVQRLVIRCFQCKYWDGDKAKVQAEYKNNPCSMDLFKGWPESGRCLIEYEWAEIEVNGNATADLKVPANFSCPYAAV